MEEDGKNAASEHLSFIEELNTERPTLVFFLLSRNLFKHTDTQVRTRDAVIVKSKEMTAAVALGEEG